MGGGGRGPRTGLGKRPIGGGFAPGNCAAGYYPSGGPRLGRKRAGLAVGGPGPGAWRGRKPQQANAGGLAFASLPAVVHQLILSVASPLHFFLLEFSIFPF